MNVLKDWLLGITAVALVLSLAQAVTPEGTVKKIGTLIGGMVLLLALTRPLLNLDGKTLTDFAKNYALPNEAELNQGEDKMKVLIAEKTSAYIVDKGAPLGITCTADVSVQEDENGWPIPWEAELSGDWTPEGRAALGKALEEELGIPPDRQHFGEVVP